MMRTKALKGQAMMMRTELPKGPAWMMMMRTGALKITEKPEMG